MKKIEWTHRWKMIISDTPVLPGVWRRKDGSFVVRGHAVDPRTGRMREIRRVLDVADAKVALAWLTNERERIRRGLAQSEAKTQTPRFREFAASVFEAKVNDGSIASAKGREKWAVILEHHLFTAPWADFFVDKIRHADLIDWRNSLPTRVWTRRNKKGEVVKTGTYSPLTLNDWLAVARVVFAAASRKHDLPRDPMLGIEDFSTDNHRTYTREQPNALPPERVSAWLAAFKERYPQFYAMVFLGLVLGHRPSTLRPLRRKGPERDIDLDAKSPRLLVRRSHTLRQEVWNQTKTRSDQDIAVDRSVADVLRWHVETQLLTEAQKRSDLLFPNARGGFRSKSCLDKPFKAVSAACKLGMHLTPRALRRTFQDLTRAKKIEGVIAKAISGHATDAMRVHYSTAHDAEVEKAMGRIVDLALARKRSRRRTG